MFVSKTVGGDVADLRAALFAEILAAQEVRSVIRFRYRIRGSTVIVWLWRTIS
jgi:hypothetical protein